MNKWNTKTQGRENTQSMTYRESQASSSGDEEEEGEEKEEKGDIEKKMDLSFILLWSQFCQISSGLYLGKAW